MIQSVFTFVGVSLTIISAILAIIKFKFLNPGLRIIFAFVLISIMSDFIAIVISLSGNIPSLWLNIYTIPESIIFGLFYYWLFKNSGNGQLKLIISTLVIGIIAIIILIFTEPLTPLLNTLSLRLEATIFIFISVGYFYEMLNKMEFDNPFNNPIFWMNAGVLIYFSGSFFSFMFSAVQYPQFGLGIWIVHNAVRTIFAIFILIGFWKVRKT
jgi:hypothetical protein